MNKKFGPRTHNFCPIKETPFLSMNQRPVLTLAFRAYHFNFDKNADRHNGVSWLINAITLGENGVVGRDIAFIVYFR